MIFSGKYESDRVDSDFDAKVRPHLHQALQVSSLRSTVPANPRKAQTREAEQPKA